MINLMNNEFCNTFEISSTTTNSKLLYLKDSYDRL